MQVVKEYVADKKKELASLISTLSEKPKLIIINVGDDPASKVYIKGKIKDCAEVGIDAEVIHYDADVTESELLNKISELNEDVSVTGFIVQLPVPKHIDGDKLIAAIKPEKDVDGFTKSAMVNPATPQGILSYLENQNIEFEDKNAVVIGRSNIVGKPMAKLLLGKNCNVTVLHSKTSEINKREYLKNADIIVVAVGKRHIIDKTYELKPSAVIMDVGMNRNEDGKLCGDCDYDDLIDRVRFISPVPGAVGLTTRLTLLTNLLKLYFKNRE